MIGGIRPAAMIAASGTGAVQSQTDPAVSLETELIVLDNLWMKKNGLAYDQLKVDTGWEALSKAFYGTEEHSGALKKANGDVVAPMDVNNAVKSFACSVISEKYCAPVIARVMLEKKEKLPPVSTAPARAPEARPTVQAKKIEAESGPENTGSVSVSIHPRSGVVGGEGELVVKIKGRIDAEGEPDIHIERRSGVNIFSEHISVGEDGRTLKVPIDLIDAVPGRYTITVKIGGETVGAARFTVESPSQE